MGDCGLASSAMRILFLSRRDRRDSKKAPLPVRNNEGLFFWFSECVNPIGNPSYIGKTDSSGRWLRVNVMEIYFLIGGLGLITGFLSGLIGIGGGIVMAPLLLYVPPLFGFDPLPMRIVAGLTITQGLLGCLSGAVSHRRVRVL